MTQSKLTKEQIKKYREIQAIFKSACLERELSAEEIVNILEDMKDSLLLYIEKIG